MKVVEPMDIFDSVVIDYGDDTTPLSRSDDYNLVEWDSSESEYIFGDEVKVIEDRKKYKLAASSVDAGVVPSENPTIWISSPLAEYAMFEYDNDYQGVFYGDVKFTINDANIIDTVFFQDIDGDTITVELIDGDNTVIDTFIEDIYDLGIDSFETYLFPNESVLKRKMQFDFISLSVESIRVTISGTNTKCRYCVVGYKDDFNITLRDGLGYSQQNFYKYSRDAWGNLLDSQVRIIENLSIPVFDYNANIERNVNKLFRLYGDAKLWIADDRDKANVEFDFINIFAKLISASVAPAAVASKKILKLEGK